MDEHPGSTVVNVFRQFVASRDYTSTKDTSTTYSNEQTASRNSSLHEECIQIRFGEMEFLPWNNVANIVSEDVERYARVVRNYMLALLIGIGGPANVINMTVFYRQSLKDRVNLCLFSLSLADEIYLVAACLLHGGDISQEYGPVATFITNTNLLTFIGFFVVSFVLSAIIACERCYCVLSPLKYQTLMRTRTMAFIIVMVYVSVAGLFYVVSFRYHIGCVHDPVSGIVFSAMVANAFYTRHQQVIDILDSLVLGVGLNGTVMIVVVTATTMTTVKLRQAMIWRTAKSSTLSSRDVALTKMLIGTSVLFIICAAPTCLIRVASLLFPELNTGRRYQNFYFTSLWIAEVFTFVNSSFNIFVYYKMGSRYRKTFRALFSRNAQSEKS